MGLLAEQPYSLPQTGGPGEITLLKTPIGSGRERRDILVALPPATAPGPHPVFYLQDGQNLFDPATSHAGDWGLVATLNLLAKRGIAALAVGIPNRGRHRKHEYNPFRDLRSGGGGGDRYLHFLIEEIKPHIDRSFPTRSGPEHTVIVGSSLGGLISLYALCSHPDVFGAAGLLSPALWVARRAIYRFVEDHPPSSTSRLYLDVGTAEGREEVEDVRELRDLLLRKRASSRPALSYLEDPGGEHTEEAWGRRFRDAIGFLVGRPGRG